MYDIRPQSVTFLGLNLNKSPEFFCERLFAKVDERRSPYRGRSAQNIKGGWGGIRTPGTVSRTAVFKTAAFNHSATHPTLVGGESHHGQVYQGRSAAKTWKATRLRRGSTFRIDVVVFGQAH